MQLTILNPIIRSLLRVAVASEGLHITYAIVTAHPKRGRKIAVALCRLKLEKAQQKTTNDYTTICVGSVYLIDTKQLTMNPNFYFPTLFRKHL